MKFNLVRGGNCKPCIFSSFCITYNFSATGKCLTTLRTYVWHHQTSCCLDSEPNLTLCKITHSIFTFCHVWIFVILLIRYTAVAFHTNVRTWCHARLSNYMHGGNCGHWQLMQECCNCLRIWQVDTMVFVLTCGHFHSADLINNCCKFFHISYRDKVVFHWVINIGTTGNYTPLQ